MFFFWKIQLHCRALPSVLPLDDRSLQLFFVLLELPWTLLWEMMFIRIVAATNWLDLKASKHLHDTHLMTFHHITQLLVKWLNFYGMLNIVFPWLANVHTVYDCAAQHLEIVLADFCWRKDFPSISEESNMMPWLNVGSVIAASHWSELWQRMSQWERFSHNTQSAGRRI